MSENYRVEDAFTTAKHAEWAGDVEYCRKQLTILNRLTSDVPEDEGWHPLELLRQAGQMLEKLLVDREPAPPELVVTTDHLRGIVWQTGRREFEMRAYLTEPTWEDSIYRHAWHATKARSVIRVEPEEEDEDEERNVPDQGNLFQEGERAPEVDEGEGISWEENAEGLLCLVTVGDLALIKLKGTWTGDGIPQSAGEIVRRFRTILERIESPDTP